MGNVGARSGSPRLASCLRTQMSLCLFISYPRGCATVVNIFFFFNDTATPEIYPLSLHDALPIRFEEDDGFEIVAECDATSVEVDDLRHWPVGVGVELEPDARAGDVVTVQRFRDFNLASIPDGILCRFRRRRDRWPCRGGKMDRFTVGQIAGVEPPLAGREGIQGFQDVQPFDCGGR